jgi:hypothetical protein
MGRRIHTEAHRLLDSTSQSARPDSGCADKLSCPNLELAPTADTFPGEMGALEHDEFSEGVSDPVERDFRREPLKKRTPSGPAHNGGIPLELL